VLLFGFVGLVCNILTNSSPLAPIKAGPNRLDARRRPVAITGVRAHDWLLTHCPRAGPTSWVQYYNWFYQQIFSCLTTHSQYANTKIIIINHTILSTYFVLSDTHTVSTQTQILLLQSTQFYHHILPSLATHTHWVQKHKLYYYNLHDFFPAISSNFHNTFSGFIWKEFHHCSHVHYVFYISNAE